MKSGTVSLHLAPVALPGSRDRQTGDSVWPSKDATGLKSGEDSVNGRDQCSQCAPIHVCVWHGRDRMRALTHSLTHSLTHTLRVHSLTHKLTHFLTFSAGLLLAHRPCLGRSCHAVHYEYATPPIVEGAPVYVASRFVLLFRGHQATHGCVGRRWLSSGL